MFSEIKKKFGNFEDKKFGGNDTKDNIINWAGSYHQR